ncbi:MAG: glycosyltransferase family 2 protein, partial [Planctomycetota bacterium]
MFFIFQKTKVLQKFQFTMNQHITVIMSIHNNEKTLRAAVESIQKQTYKDWDMIVVDDASTDGSRDLLLNVSKDDPRIQLLLNTNNIGLAASLNKALGHAKGPLIARMDGDDICFPERFE